MTALIPFLRKCDFLIKANNISRKYKEKSAIKNVSIHVKKGEIYGFLGPNGAGKTTMIKIITGLIRPDYGEVKIFGNIFNGKDTEIKKRMGVIFETSNFYEKMTGYEYLKFFSDLYELNNIQNIYKLLKKVGIGSDKNELISTYSNGMKKRLSWARCLLHDPELLILDEPISGLDPHGTKEMRDIIIEQNQLGKTVFISSHILSEIEKTCNRVGIIDKGELLLEDTVSCLNNKLNSKFEIHLILKEINTKLLNKLKEITSINSLFHKNKNSVVISSTVDCREDISRIVYENSGVLLEMYLKKMDLEDSFIKLTRKDVNILLQE